jgi:hypothetical protein
MDALTFVVQMTQALAWPVAAIVLVLLLRRPLVRLIPLIQKLRYGPFELDFGRQIAELAMEAERELPATDQPDSGGEAARLTGLAQVSPRAAVLEAWLQVEQAAMALSQREGLALSSQELRTPLLLGQALEQAGSLDDAKMAIYHQLRNLRNAAAHATNFELDTEAALEYVRLALRLAAYLRKG